MSMKRIIGAAMTTCFILAAIFTYKTNYAAVSEPEAAIKSDIFSAQYEALVPSTWLTASKLNSPLTRKDAGYLAVYALSKASGKAIDWMDYSTSLADTTDPMLSRAVDNGLMSADENQNYNPQKTVTQEGYAVVMTKLLYALDSYEKPTKALAYKDKAKISSWAKESVQYVSEKGLVKWPTTNGFEPQKPMTLGRAISLTNQLLIKQGVYNASKPILLTKTQQYQVSGYTLPMPLKGLSEWQIAVTNGELNLYFTGVIIEKGIFSHKSVMEQLNTILDSKSNLSTATQVAVLSTIMAHFDLGTQQYAFPKTVYVRLDSGATSETKPSGESIKISAGSGVTLTMSK